MTREGQEGKSISEKVIRRERTVMTRNMREEEEKEKEKENKTKKKGKKREEKKERK